MKDMTGRVVFVLGATLGLPAALAAQACVGSPAPANGVAIYGAGGYFSYDLNQTIKGPQYGAGLAIGLPGPVSFDFNGLMREPQSGAGLYAGTAKAFINVRVPAFASFCVTAGVGVSRLSDTDSQSSNTTFGVPLGLRFGPSLNVGLARLDPFVEPFVLFAQTSGTVFNINTSASAVGGGANAGLMLHAGPILAGVTLRVTQISEDVGSHPYADRAVLVRFGFAF